MPPCEQRRRLLRPSASSGRSATIRKQMVTLPGISKMLKPRRAEVISESHVAIDTIRPTHITDGTPFHPKFEGIVPSAAGKGQPPQIQARGFIEKQIVRITPIVDDLTQQSLILEYERGADEGDAHHLVRIPTD